MSTSMSAMTSGRPKRAQRAVPVLSWLTPLAGAVSVINVTISMCTGEWLLSRETIPVDTPNATHREEFQVKRTVSGLWRLCYSNTTDEVEMHCFSIDYFAKDRYVGEISDSTMAIPYAVTRAGPLFIVASILLLTGILSAALGHSWRSRRIATFVAGIIFIVAGLIMLIGLVVYLSVLQSEIGSKLRPRGPLDDPVFSYSYGFGFILIVVGFMSTELTGICSIFWYIYWHQLDWAQKAGNGSCNNLSGGGETSSYNHHRPAHYGPSPYLPRHQQSSRSRSRHNSGPNLGDLNNFHPSTPSYYSYTKINPDGSCKRHGGGGGGGGGSHRCNMHPYNYHASNSSRPTPMGWDMKYPGNLRPPNHSYYDDDFDLDVPLPPPPPFPRDITCTTTVSADDFFGDRSGSLGRSGREREHRKTTPV